MTATLPERSGMSDSFKSRDVILWSYDHGNGFSGLSFYLTMSSDERAHQAGRQEVAARNACY